MRKYPKPGFGEFKAADSSPVKPGMPSILSPVGPRFRQPPDTRAGTSASPRSSEATISRTTLPTKRHIRCYDCAYEFNLTGRMSSTHCPKCRVLLDLAGYTIDTECRETLKTLGKIKITSRGILASAQLLATDIDLAGKVTNSSIEALRELILFPGADFTRGHIKAVDLKIEAGGKATFRDPALYRNVEVIGTFIAPLYATGLITIRTGAMFIGLIRGGRLIVEDGATFVADANISAEGLAEAEKMKEQMATFQPGATERVLVTVAPSPAPAS